MFKKVIKAIENIIFEPEEEINEAQYLTLLSLAKKTYVDMAHKDDREAAQLAVTIVEKWIVNGEYKKYLKGLWRNLKVA